MDTLSIWIKYDKAPLFSYRATETLDYSKLPGMNHVYNKTPSGNVVNI